MPDSALGLAHPVLHPDKGPGMKHSDEAPEGPQAESSSRPPEIGMSQTRLKSQQ